MKRKYYLCRVLKDYSDFLYDFDDRVRKKETRPYLMLAFKLNKYDYAIPLTSEMLRKNGKRRNVQTTVELKDNIYCYGALLINNMIPITEDLVLKIDINGQPSNSKTVLQSEVQLIRKQSDEISKKTNSVYLKRICGENEFYNSFCCDFKLLEEKCIEYCKLHNLKLPLDPETEKLKREV
ncbi:MAG: type III toxin-antitoxin system ToxN/AbiQ family toxin, partial [Oscillospiraceae bacterium]